MFAEYSQRPTYTGAVTPFDAIEASLSSSGRKNYLLWRDGNDYRSLVSPTSFKKWQHEFAALGIDLLSKPADRDHDIDVGALWDFEKLGIPDFARHEPMLLLGAQTLAEAAQPPQPEARMHIYSRPAAEQRDANKIDMTPADSRPKAWRGRQLKR